MATYYDTFTATPRLRYATGHCHWSRHGLISRYALRFEYYYCHYVRRRHYGLRHTHIAIGCRHMKIRRQLTLPHAATLFRHLRHYAYYFLIYAYATHYIQKQ